MTALWMSDDDLDETVVKRLEDTGSEFNFDDWRECMDGEWLDDTTNVGTSGLSSGQAFLNPLGIIVSDVRDADDMLEWLVEKLPE